MANTSIVEKIADLGSLGNVVPEGYEFHAMEGLLNLPPITEVEA